MKKAIYAFSIIAFISVLSVYAQDANTDDQSIPQSTQPAATDTTINQQESEGMMNEESEGMMNEESEGMNEESEGMMPPGNTQMPQEGSQTVMPGSMTTTSSQPQGEILDLSSLNQEVTEQQRAEFMSIAQEHANNLREKAGLDADETEEVREAIVEYLEEEWEARISLDQSPDRAAEHNADLANARVELSSEIKDILSDEQVQQWEKAKVDWWTSLDQASFDVQQESAATAMARGNNSDTENTDDDSDQVQ
ncbi:MAG: hypothetical protein R6W90_10455 [Ignavibacteriaceae bacterium]